MKRFCTAKGTINKTKRQPTDWEKIFTNDVTNKGLVSKIYKQLMRPNNMNDGSAMELIIKQYTVINNNK